MSVRLHEPYVKLLRALGLSEVHHAVLATGRLELEGIAQGTVDLGLAVVADAQSTRALARTLATCRYRFDQTTHPHSVEGVVAVTLRPEDTAEDGAVHIVLVPPSQWQATSAERMWRPFGPLVVPVIPWQHILRPLTPPVQELPSHHKRTTRPHLALVRHG